MTQMAGSAQRGLQIYNARERRLVGAVDALLSPLRWFRRSSNTTAIRRVLLLRLERIGDLLDGARSDPGRARGMAGR